MCKSIRIQWLDAVRGGAILCVILCHVTENVYQLNEKFISSVSVYSKIFAFLAFTCGRMGVPLFLYISGYLLLDRNYGRDGAFLFWKRNLLNLLITVEIWMVAYNIFICLFKGEKFYVTTLIKNMLFLKSVGLSHMWYMPMIIGLYIFLPFVADFLQNTEIRVLGFPLVILYVYLFCVPVFNVLCQMYGYQQVGSLLDLNYGGGVYGFYLICGYFVKKGVFKRISFRSLLLCGISFFVGTVVLQIFAFDHQYSYTVWYNNGLLFICVLSFFELFSRFPIKKTFRIIGDLSKSSFGIYLIHNPILMILRKNMIFKCVMPIQVICLFICTIVISWSIVSIFGRIPKVGKFIFYMK